MLFWEDKVKTKLTVSALAAAALLSTSVSVQAQEVVEWWDFLGGGDGVRMKTLIDEFNAEHAGQIQIQASTLDWGTPFYTKVQTSAAVGEGPDVMTYHTSRIPLAIDGGVLDPITADDWAKLGLSSADFPEAIWDAITVDGTQYAVPLDTHPVVLYYNKDILGAAGLLDENGMPTGLDGIENFSAALQAVKDAGATWGISTFTASGNFTYRTIYSLVCQQGGEVQTNGEWLAGDNYDKHVNAIRVLADWVADGYMQPYTEYPAGVALFTSGESAFHVNGVWEVPTMTDLYAKGELFEWGAIELPVFFDQPCTYSDSHAFAIPNNVGAPIEGAKRDAVLTVVRWMLDHGLFWATAGHIPALNAVTSSPEYQTMEPNATYAVLTANMIYDPKSKYAGVASPMFDAAGNAFTAAINNEVSPEDAVADMKAELDFLE